MIKLLLLLAVLLPLQEKQDKPNLPWHFKPMPMPVRRTISKTIVLYNISIGSDRVLELTQPQNGDIRSLFIKTSGEREDEANMTVDWSREVEAKIEEILLPDQAKLLETLTSAAMLNQYMQFIQHRLLRDKSITKDEKRHLSKVYTKVREEIFEAKHRHRQELEAIFNANEKLLSDTLTADDN